jgi:hypothetical protein
VRLTLPVCVSLSVCLFCRNQSGQLHMPRAQAVQTATKIDLYDTYSVSLISAGFNNTFVFAENCDGPLSTSAFRRAVFYSSQSQLAALIPPRTAATAVATVGTAAAGPAAPSAAVTDSKSDDREQKYWVPSPSPAASPAAPNSPPPSATSTASLADRSGGTLTPPLPSRTPPVESSSSSASAAASVAGEGGAISRVFARPTAHSAVLVHSADFAVDSNLYSADGSGSSGSGSGAGVVVCFCSTTHALWTVSLATGAIRQHFNLPSAPTGAAGSMTAPRSADDLLAFPDSSECVFAHPSFALPASGATVTVPRLVVSMLSSLEMLSRRYDRTARNPHAGSKPDPTLRSLCYGRDAPTFRALTGVLTAVWDPFRVDRLPVREWGSFYGAALLPALRLCRMNLGKLQAESDHAIALRIAPIRSHGALAAAVKDDWADGVELSSRVALWLNASKGDLMNVLCMRNGRRYATRVLDIFEHDEPSAMPAATHHADPLGLLPATLRHLRAAAGDLVLCELIALMPCPEVTLVPVRESLVAAGVDPRTGPNAANMYADVQLSAAQLKDLKDDAEAKERALNLLKQKRFCELIHVRLRRSRGSLHGPV